jgi:hypothetical protein
VIAVATVVDVGELAVVVDVVELTDGCGTLEAVVLVVAPTDTASPDPLVHPAITISRTATPTARTPMPTGYVAPSGGAEACAQPRSSKRRRRFAAP